MKHGFSLVELSIVLVILGLLTGGILTGQSLIRASELRSYSTDTQRIQSAVNVFREKYFAIPGDFKDATKFWGSAGGTGSDAACQDTASTSAATCDGDGDGYARNSSLSGVTHDERFRFWQHLANAGLIEGSYTGTTDGATGTFIVTAGKNTPAMKGGATFTVMGLMAPTTTSVVGSFQFAGMPAGNILEFRGAGGININILTPEDTWNLDTKFDDGKPAYGIFTGPQSTWSGGVGCTTTDVPSTAAYSLTNSSKVCRFNFKI